MYKERDIREVLEEMIEDENTKLSSFKDIIVKFFNDYKNIDALSSVFCCDAFETMCEHLGIEDAHDYPYAEENTNEMLKLFQQFFDLDIDEEIKKELVHNFAKNFAECSDDADYCEGKIYIIVKNLSENNEYSIVEEFDDWDAAEKYADEWYTGCCDDLYIGENMLFPILCQVQSREWDTVMNFCSIVEFDATYIEEGRESWEQVNCDFDDCDDEDDD